MDSEQFNQCCRHLRRNSRVRVYLITGRIIEGELLSYFEAGAREGSIELNTGRGLASFPSGAIESIESTDDLRA